MTNLVRRKKAITLGGAQILAEAAIEKALELGLKISVTVVDDSGALILFEKMDEAPIISMDASRKKAMTAVGYGISTGKTWYDFIKDDPILTEGVKSLKDFTLLGGGEPLTEEGDVIGAIGVSGGHYQQDELCVAAALLEFERRRVTK